MRSMTVLCPESGQLEEIEYVESPLGILITSCTRFSPACAVKCQRKCAAQHDQSRRRQDAGDEDDTLVRIRI